MAVQKIKPLEEMVLAGFTKRFTQVFECPCLVTTATDKLKVLERTFSGKEVTYPYAFVTINTVGPNNESYNAHSLGRRGLLTIVQQDHAATVRILPANFEVEIEYHVNKYRDFHKDSVLYFLRRWMFARRFGYLKFNISYGRLSTAISLTLGDTPQVPLRENAVENETVYKVTAAATIHGYVSEATLGTQGIITALEIDGRLVNADGSLPGAQFFSFTKENT